jgi:aspartate racemase
MYRKIGILGGLSPESTISYYSYITRTYTERYGDYSYPEIIIYSVSLEKYHTWRNEGRWDKITDDMISAAGALERAGADFGVLATNTMHLVFDEFQSAVRIPFLNLIDTTTEAIKRRHISAVGLLGTRFTMSHDFFRNRLAEGGITAIVPNAEDQETVHRVIEEELCRGLIREESRREYRAIIDTMRERGAEGVILGCTEIPLLVDEQQCELPLFDTAALHAEKALQYAVGEE